MALVEINVKATLDTDRDPDEIGSGIREFIFTNEDEVLQAEIQVEPGDEPTGRPSFVERLED